MLPVFWVMGAALLAAGWFATRGNEVTRRARGGANEKRGRAIAAPFSD